MFQLIDNDEHPTAFMSKELNSAQRNYSVTKQECLAAILCVRKFRCYVEGMPFTVITDHASLKWLMSQKDLSGRLARWSLSLQAFDFQIELRKGAANIVPDALSRVNVDELLTIAAEPISLIDLAFQTATYVKLRTELKGQTDRLPDNEIRSGIIYKQTEPRTGHELVDTSQM